MRVGFIGLGRMGSGMASRLIEAGHEVTVYNRSADKARPLREKGAHVAASVADASAGEAVITMLADDPAVEGVVLGEGGVVRHLGKGAVHVSSSTISVALSARLAAAHAAAGQEYLAAPVFGRPDVAAQGKLFIAAGGSPGVIDRVQPLLSAMGQRTFVLSEKPEAANLVKLSGNFLIASVIETMGEAMALVDKGGVDRWQYLDFLTSTFLTAPIYKTYGKLIADRAFEPPGFAAPLGLKDIRLTLAASETLRAPMPVASLLRDRFLTLLAHGGDHLDWSAIGGIAAKDAGLAD